MTTSWRDGVDDMYSDEQAQNILRRAAEIEKKGTVTETDLREIAGAASISQKALDRALAEAAIDERINRTKNRTDLREDEARTAKPWYKRSLTPGNLVIVVLIGMLVASVLSSIYGK